MTLGRPGVLPPTRLFDDVIRTPSPRLPSPRLLAKSRPVVGSGRAPKKSPQSQLPCDPAPEIETPASWNPVTIRPSTRQFAVAIARPS